MARDKIGAYNLIAAFVDLTTAQRVIERLKDEGVQGGDISLLGREGTNVVTSDDGRTDDRDVIRSGITGTVAGTVGGGILGGVAGFLIGLATLAIPGVGPVITAGVWAATGLGAIAGGSAGSLVGVLTGAALSNERGAAYETHLTEGHVLVGVHADDPDEFERAFNVVVRSQPLTIDRFGRGVQAQT